jgi:hypothetical protein
VLHVSSYRLGRMLRQIQADLLVNQQNVWSELWTQAEVYVSRSSATIPRFFRGPSTIGTTSSEDSTGHASRTQYDFSKLRSRSKSSGLSLDNHGYFCTVQPALRIQSAIEMGLLPERKEVICQATMGPDSDTICSSRSLRTGVKSVRAASSQHMMIREDVS